jgi:hypothetical protein
MVETSTAPSWENYQLSHVKCHLNIIVLMPLADIYMPFCKIEKLAIVALW